MNIKEKIKNNEKMTFAFIGDSVTFGCFECFDVDDKNIDTVYEMKSSFSTRFKEIFNLLIPNNKIEIINAGISGDDAVTGKNRFYKDCLAKDPDLIVISYGLNDTVLRGIDGIDIYKDALDSMVNEALKLNKDVILLTQNYMTKYVSDSLTDLQKNIAKNVSDIQNKGILSKYYDKMREVQKNHNIKLCDIYKIYEKLDQNNIDINNILANKINHPIREMHYYVAIKLIETILDI